MNIQKRLNNELGKLKTKLGLLGNMTVRWMPNDSSAEHGKVEDSTIIVHDTRLDEALKTLRHEVIEHLLTEWFLVPRLFQSNCARRVDQLVDVLAELI